MIKYSSAPLAGYDRPAELRISPHVELGLGESISPLYLALYWIWGSKLVTRLSFPFDKRTG